MIRDTLVGGQHCCARQECLATRRLRARFKCPAENLGKATANCQCFPSGREIMQMANTGNAAPGTACCTPTMGYAHGLGGWLGATVAAMARVVLHPDLQAYSDQFAAPTVRSAGRSDRSGAERGAG